MAQGEKKMTARCGKFEKHEAHTFDKDEAKFCSGQVAYR